ncbi:MAG TPA: hypothetical protein VGF01_03350 [Terracidiphilus sp.]|jgi:hypothetical protein
MNRPILICAILLAASSVLGAQEASQANPYEGVSTPPPDNTIVTASTPHAKAPATLPEPLQTAPAAESEAVPAQSHITEPTLAKRVIADPDGDIVHPAPLRPGELPEGATISVKLLDELSTSRSEKGETFRSRVALDVVRDGQVLIPAGAEIDGRIAEVSTGHPGGHGSMLLRPEALILADGSRYQLHAVLSEMPGAKTKVGSEGTVLPASRIKRDSIEYGGAVGGGATTGAIVGGPVGAVTGGLIGAGVVSAHLLISHPQANLEPGTTLVFTLSERLMMAPVSTSGN